MKGRRTERLPFFLFQKGLLTPGPSHEPMWWTYKRFQETQRNIFIPRWTIRIVIAACSFTAITCPKSNCFHPRRQAFGVWHANSKKMHVFYNAVCEIWYCKNTFPLWKGRYMTRTDIEGMTQEFTDESKSSLITKRSLLQLAVGEAYMPWNGSEVSNMFM